MTFVQKAKYALSRAIPEARFAWRCSFRPVSCFEAVKWENKGSVAAGLFIVGLFFTIAVMNAQLTGFIFNTQNPDRFSLPTVFAVTVGGFGVVFVAHYAVSTFLPSEATVRQLFITLAYSLVPYIFTQAIVIAASNFVGAEMGVFLTYITWFGMGWTLVVLMLGMVQTHRLSFGLVLGDLALTALGAGAILFFMLLIYSLFQQVYIFFYTIFNELMFRF